MSCFYNNHLKNIYNFTDIIKFPDFYAENTEIKNSRQKSNTKKILNYFQFYFLY